MTKALQFPCLLLAISWLAGLTGHAERLWWYSVAGANNLGSSGAPMTGAFAFELGVFAVGFEPTLANKANWAANWVPAQRVNYNDTYKRFDSQFTVTSNITPFIEGKAAYIWGFQGGVTSSEWILFRGNNWAWPIPNPINPTPINWDAATASAVVGTIDADGVPFLMQSSSITDAASPPTSWLQWQAAELAGVPLKGPNDDPDHDGTSNALEYVFGTSPTQVSAPPATPMQIVTVSAQQYMQITIPRRIDHPATLIVQASSDLTNWAEGTAVTVVVSNNPSALVVRDLTPLGPDTPRRFMRVQAELQQP